MKTLFIDSSRKSLSVALASGDKLVFVSNVESYSKHSNYLMNEIQDKLNKSNLTIYDVDNIVVLNGPGSFTGVRVGVTISKTIAWVLSKKLYQLNNLEALKINADNTNSDVVICIIPDKEKNSYVGIYSDNNKYEDYASIDDDVFNIKDKKITIVSMEENPFMNNLNEKLSSCNNVDLKIMQDYDYLKVINYALSKPDINPHLAEPIYLKKIDAEKSNNAN